MRKLIFGFLLSFLLFACHNDTKKSFNGYIDADLVYLSSDFGGRLVDLSVQKGQAVQNNQFLFKLEQTGELYKVEMSQLNYQDLMAQRQQILVQLEYNNINYKRTLQMRKQNAASQNDLEVAKKDWDISRQQLAAIDAKMKNNQVDTADKKWVVKRKESHAPDAGIVFDTYYTQGEFVQGGYPVLSLVTKKNIKAIFFVPEYRLSHIRLNQKVRMSSDNDPDFATGHISYISNSAQYTSPIIYSQEERQRLVFRVEAKIDSPDLERIHFGQPISLELDQ